MKHTTEAQSINRVLREAEQQGGWADYAVYVMGDAECENEELNDAIENLYRANEHMHRVANKLALHYDLDFFEVGHE